MTVGRARGGPYTRMETPRQGMAPPASSVARVGDGDFSEAFSPGRFAEEGSFYSDGGDAATKERGEQQYSQGEERSDIAS